MTSVEAAGGGALCRPSGTDVEGQRGVSRIAPRRQANVDRCRREIAVQSGAVLSHLDLEKIPALQIGRPLCWGVFAERGAVANRPALTAAPMQIRSPLLRPVLESLSELPTRTGGTGFSPLVAPQGIRMEGPRDS